MTIVKIIQGDIHHSGQEDWKERAESQVNNWLQENSIEPISVLFVEDAKNSEHPEMDSWSATITYTA